MSIVHHTKVLQPVFPSFSGTIRNNRQKLLLLFMLLFFVHSSSAGDTTLFLKKTIRGGLTPKSVVHNGKGIFFAQNMMYNHTITVYDKDYRLVKVINDKVQLEKFGFEGYEGEHRGAPVECAFSHNGDYAWVSNYTMSGKGFDHPGCDSCTGTKFDPGFIYKINTNDFAIEKIVKAGSVPKYLAVSPDNKFLLVSNWSSADVSVIDLETESEIKRIPVGRFPRGIAIDNKSKYAYVAVMGGTSIVRIDLSTMLAEKFAEVGRGPRHLCLDQQNEFLYATVNTEGKIARINLQNGVVEKLHIGGTPRSMVLSSDSRFIYIVNYSAAKITKVETSGFKIRETAVTGANPIGITYNQENGEIWVACYSGSLMIYSDSEAQLQSPMLSDYNVIIPALNDFYATTIKILSPPVSITPGKAKPEKITAEKKNESIVEEKKKAESKKPEIKVPPAPEIKKTTPVQPITSSGNHFVVVGSFKNPDNAKRKKDEMIKKGFPCEIIDRPNGMSYTAVGGFSSKPEAEQTMKKIIASGMDAWIWIKE
jgi:YVTN family beta-propeller protein